MKMLSRIGLLATGALACIGTPAHADDYPAIPPTPAAIEELVYAVPFTVDEAYVHCWSMEGLMVTSGYLLVLKVDGDLVFPRQVAEPVLYVGNQTAERLNHGYESGHVIALVPAVIDPSSDDYLNLAESMIWFGNPDLPEQVTANTIATQASLAKRAGIKPFSSDDVAFSREKGGEQLHLPTKAELLKVAGGLVQEYSPQETYVIEALLGTVPTVEGAAAGSK